MKKFKKIMLLILCMFPMIVLAKESDVMPVSGAILMEAFVSIHMSLFVLAPLSKVLSPENSKKTFWTLFIARVLILLFFDFFVTTAIAIVDFIAIFVGAFIVVPITSKITKNKVVPDPIMQTQVPSTQTSASDGTKVVKEAHVYPSHFPRMYQLSDDLFLKEYLEQESSKIGLDLNSTLIPEEILKRKKVFNIIFSLLLTAFTCLIFFHFNTPIYIGGVIILVGFFILTRRYNLMKYLIKEIKSRPQEKITNILMNIKTNFTEDNSKSILFIGFVVAIITPCLLFMNPRIMYEEIDGYYSLRFYTMGIKQPTKVVIPDTYKGKPVVSIRGNVFAYLPRVEEIVLPDTITEIRGQAFENSKDLKTVKLPSNLVSLGGGAFRNCESLEKIEFPDTTIEIGGEAFLNAYSLREVKLPKNLSEIRGNTFENCTSLISIEIPDPVTRIGGHAFRNCTSLESVYISENSKLEEIGSSAFRVCHSLRSIMLPPGVYVNDRAFKESPTDIYYYEGHEFNQ